MDLSLFSTNFTFYFGYLRILHNMYVIHTHRRKKSLYKNVHLLVSHYNKYYYFAWMMQDAVLFVSTFLRQLGETATLECEYTYWCLLFAYTYTVHTQKVKPYYNYIKNIISLS